jgi:glycosyltransferase involved in cell wall biosynthesis
VRILFLSEYYPFKFRTDVFGVFQRMRLLLDAMSGLGELDLLFLAPFGVDASPSAIRQLEKDIEAEWHLRVNAFVREQSPAAPRPLRERVPIWVRSVARGAVAFEYEITLNNSHEPSLRAVRECLDRRPDVICAFRLGSMAPLLRIGRPLPPVFFDLDDAEHVKAVRLARGRPGLAGRVRGLGAVPILWWSERRAMALARSTFVASTRDRDRFRYFPRHSERVVVPNAVRVPPPQGLAGDPTMLFLGNYIYGPNVEAAEYLLQEIWPRVREVVPNARLLIAGSEPERICFHASPPPGVEFTGFVEDLGDLYRRTRVVCCPIRVAGGTRLKILEAASYGKPIVSTTVGAEGIELRNGREIFLRDEPTSFAAACAAVMTDTSLGQQMGAAARRVVGQLYERDIVIAQIRKTVVDRLGAA